MEFRFDKTDRQAMSNSVENVSEKEMSSYFFRGYIIYG